MVEWFRLAVRMCDELGDAAPRIREAREFAIHYLRDTDMRVGEIATLLGYGDPSNFGAAFRTWTGKSPRAYRRKV